MKRVAAAVAVVIGVLAAFTGSAGAITGGELDGNRHPNVAMIVFYQPDGRFRCSATLVSPTVLVTAAHCTDGVRGKIIVKFDPVAPDPHLGRPTTPATAVADRVHVRAGGMAHGTPHAHPLWDGELQLNDLHDVGVVVLDAPYTGGDASEAAAAQLPRRPSRRATAASTSRSSPSSGYGVYFEKPAEGPAEAGRRRGPDRRFTDRGRAERLVAGAEAGREREGLAAEGGSCFGDSGGPVFHGRLPRRRHQLRRQPVLSELRRLLPARHR